MFIFDEIVYPQAQKSTPLSNIQSKVGNLIYPTALISFPSQICHETHSISDASHATTNDSLESIDDSATLLPSCALLIQTHNQSPPPIQ